MTNINDAPDRGLNPDDEPGLFGLIVAWSFLAVLFVWPIVMFLLDRSF